MLISDCDCRRSETGDAVIEAENVSGIDRAEQTLGPGVTILAGENATNRTSFLQALMAATGSDNVSLKGDADRGRVHATLSDTAIEREFERRNGGVRSDGERLLGDLEPADLFAFSIRKGWTSIRISIRRFRNPRTTSGRLRNPETIRQIQALWSVVGRS